MSSSDFTPLLFTQEQFINEGLLAVPAPINSTCTICTDDFKQNDKAVRPSPCANCVFHEECIFSWFNSTSPRRGTCPNDRTPLFQVRPHPESLLDGLGPTDLRDIVSRIHLANIQAEVRSDGDPETAAENNARIIQIDLDFLRSINGLALSDVNILTLWNTHGMARLRETLARVIQVMRQMCMNTGSLPQEAMTRYTRLCLDVEAELALLRVRFQEASDRVVSQGT